MIDGDRHTDRHSSIDWVGRTVCCSTAAAAIAFHHSIRDVSNVAENHRLAASNVNWCNLMISEKNCCLLDFSGFNISLYKIWRGFVKHILYIDWVNQYLCLSYCSRIVLMKSVHSYISSSKRNRCTLINLCVQRYVPVLIDARKPDTHILRTVTFLRNKHAFNHLLMPLPVYSGRRHNVFYVTGRSSALPSIRSFVSSVMNTMF